MIARVPASSANLGPGFDTLAIALGLHVEVSIDKADAFSMSSSGFGAGQFDGPDHMAAVIARKCLGHDRFALHVHSDIPVARGLGSSAALAVAAAAAAGYENVLSVGTEVDGHVENAAASVFGGLVVGGFDGDRVAARSLPLDSAWRFVVVIPDQELATADARRVLPSTVSLHDAVVNLNKMGLLIAGLANHEQFVASSMEDTLHQPYRMGLLDFAAPLLDLLRDAGAKGSCWSGAGSTMLGLCIGDDATVVASAAESFLASHSVPGRVLVLDADRQGVVVSGA
jgi:homoserine kinase